MSSKIQNYTLLCGDATNPSNYPEYADLILTDPPFMPAVKGYEQIREKNDVMLDPIETPDHQSYPEFWAQCCKIWANILSETGYLMFKTDDYTSREMYSITQDQMFKWKYTIVWDKKAIGLGHTFRKQHELIDVYVKGNKTPYWKQRSLVKKSYHGSSQNVAFRSVLSFLAVRNGMHGRLQEQKHINQTPKELWKYIIPYVCPPNGIILDPFMGSGSILSAIIDLNRSNDFDLHYCGFDKNDQFYLQSKSLLPGNNSLDKFTMGAFI